MQERKNSTYTRRVSQVGNSLSVGIPKELALKFDILKGDEVIVTEGSERGEIVLKKINHTGQPNIRPEVIEAMKSVKNQYGKAYQRDCKGIGKRRKKDEKIKNNVLTNFRKL
ncbi:AbrB/MazE/SpoVT family DNA-binding domain-containing protein [Pseudalkalibacillus decolorationis]|uniref:AbrB/MazE/SpoVT family DNA-binding domain-containing protein n=1 Tax=Pseudalkalibacillus decolorationis TaxID=163879 RepID=UPI0021486B73|nr:AbrB/MazE/SpoVT family DNA-binding domain-containing protein [Pseudalkalibacillus decolorationis]